MIVKTGDTNIEFRNEYDRFNSVYYKGNPFSGTFIDGKESIPYKNGAIHGKYLVKFDNGDLQAKEEYENGKCISGIWYHQNGQVSTKWSENFEYTRWNEDGILVQKKNINYFPNGQISHVLEDPITIFFSPVGDEVYRRENGKTEEGKYFTKLLYNDLNLEKWHFELLKEIPFENQDGKRIHWILMWTWEIFEKEPKKYFKIISKLINHPNEKVKVHFCNLVAFQNFIEFIEPENEANKDAYKLINENLERYNRLNPSRKTKEVNL